MDSRSSHGATHGFFSLHCDSQEEKPKEKEEKEKQAAGSRVGEHVALPIQGFEWLQVS